MEDGPDERLRNTSISLVDLDLEMELDHNRRKGPEGNFYHRLPMLAATGGKTKPLHMVQAAVGARICSARLEVDDRMYD
jgi:hypothetical protein